MGHRIATIEGLGLAPIRRTLLRVEFAMELIQIGQPPVRTVMQLIEAMIARQAAEIELLKKDALAGNARRSGGCRPRRETACKAA